MKITAKNVKQGYMLKYFNNKFRVLSISDRGKKSVNFYCVLLENTPSDEYYNFTHRKSTLVEIIKK